MDFKTGEGYLPKNLLFGSTARTKLIDGITKMADAVGSTLGPSGRTVLIESPQHVHGITVTKDGVTVARSIDLLDPVENLAVRMMREAAEKTATSAGDGTTTSVVITKALVMAAQKHILPEHNVTEVLRNLVDIGGKVVENLKEKSKKVTPSMLIDVASLSANNDRSIGRVIAETYKSVGKTGVVTVEKSQTHETFAEVTLGLKFDRGYSSDAFINNQKHDECIYEDVFVLVADTEIANLLQIENLLKSFLGPDAKRDDRKLLVIAPCSAQVVNTLAFNVAKDAIKVCCVAPPNFGYKQHELMQDIAVSVGAKYFSEKTGDDLSLITFGDLGHASKIIVSKDKTVIIRSSARSDQEIVDQRVAQLKDAHKNAKRKADKDFILERIASLSGGIGVIFVGGNTDLEQKELYDRVDDAVCAVRSALEEGVLCGAGKSLFEIPVFGIIDDQSSEAVVAAEIMADALSAPLIQILANAGINFSDIYARNGIDDIGMGYNLKTKTYGDLIKMGIVDPTKVTRCALQNAVSVAVTILSTNAIVTVARTYDVK